MRFDSIFLYFESYNFIYMKNYEKNMKISCKKIKIFFKSPYKKELTYRKIPIIINM